MLHLVTEKTIGRIRAWRKLTADGNGGFPEPDYFHFCDDSLQMISAAQYERFVLPRHERLYSAMTEGERRIHLCGRSPRRATTASIAP